MKTALRILLLSASMILCPVVVLTTGCQAPSAQINGDPVVVNAERAIALSFDTIDTFLRWERQNSAIVPPNVAAVARTLRIEAPDKFRNARSVLRAYKGTRSPEQRVLLDQWLAVLAESARIAKGSQP